MIPSTQPQPGPSRQYQADQPDNSVSGSDKTKKNPSFPGRILRNRMHLNTGKTVNERNMNVQRPTVSTLSTKTEQSPEDCELQKIAQEPTQLRTLSNAISRPEALVTARKRPGNSADDPSQPIKISKKTPEIEVLSAKNEQLRSFKMYSTTSFSTKTTGALSDSIESPSLSGKKELLETGNNSGRVIVKVTNTVSKITLAKAFQEIEKLPTYDFENTGNKLRQVQIIDPDKTNTYLFPSNVTFDASGELSDTETFDSNFAPHTDSINKMCKEALQTMGRKLNWRDYTVEACCFLLRYPLTSKQKLICNMPWHKDTCTLTMSTLLSSYNQHDNGFFGGALSFAKESKISSILGRRFGKPEKATLKTFEYKEPGYGFIFDGINSLHKLENVFAVNEEMLAKQPVERVLLTCFTKPSEDHVRNLSVALGDENLA